MFQVVGGCCSTSLIRTIDLRPLNPYFHGTTSFSGAPFCGGRVSPYAPVAKIVSGCKASSSRSPSTYGQSRTSDLMFGICFGSASDSNATYLACESGCTWSNSFDSGNPTHGTIIDHLSTQR